MNTITIKSWDDFVNKQKTILLHGKEHNKGMQFYKELCPCVVEIQTDCIRDIAKRFFESRNPWNSPDGNDFCRFETVMNQGMTGSDFYESECFKETADILRGFGFNATADYIDDGSYTYYSFDEDGDSLERLFTVYGENKYLNDYESYTKTSDYKLWNKKKDPAGLGVVEYTMY